ncbi:MAG: hypothetical protein HFF90_08690 [Oscillibacter sp.]|nr:hypothetical protein [Oscillibacter sp.]
MEEHEGESGFWRKALPCQSIALIAPKVNTLLPSLKMKYAEHISALQTEKERCIIKLPHFTEKKCVD